jgi:SAM-dependent methyltransferase
MIRRQVGNGRIRGTGKRLARKVLGDRYFRLFPGGHRGAVGGMWDRHGQIQLEYLRSEGLEPQHQFLDVGCGALRGGVHFVRYLEPGHYCGLDLNPHWLAAGRVELDRAGLSDRGALLHQTNRFDATTFEREFDYAFAQSVFTHVPLNSILLCLHQVEKVLKPGGRFYATFFHNPEGTKTVRTLEWPQPDVAPTVSYPDRDPFHYGVDAFEWLCDASTLEPSFIGDWGSPRGQSMMLFTKVAAPGAAAA